MTTLTDYQPILSKQDENAYVTTGEIAVGVIWCAFYLTVLVCTIASPIFSNVIEIAARY